MINPVKAKKIRAIHDDVLIRDMHMGEMKTQSGLIIGSDNGKAHGVKPRWGKVYATGPEQKDVKVGDWILVEHGRWTRKFPVDIDGEVIELQKVETKSIIGWQEEEPDTNYWAQEYSDGATASFDPSMFVERMQ